MKKRVVAALFMACSMVFTLPTAGFAEETQTEESAEAEETTEAEETAEAEDAAEAETAEEKAEDELSDDPYSFSAKVGDQIYQFPMTYAEFIEKGEWEVVDYYKDEVENMLTPNSYTFLGLEKDGNEITAYVINYDINEVPMKECYIGGIEVETSYDFDASLMEVVLPGGIKVGEATLDSIQAAYGTPSDTYAAESYVKLTYEKDSYNYLELRVDTETGVLSDVEIRNFAEPEGFTAGEVSKDVPDIAANYKVPEALTDDYTDPVVEYFGDLYQLPAPVSAFLANGWTLEDIGEEDYVAGDGFAAVNMTKDNQTQRVYLYNDAHNATAYANCMIHELGFYTYDSEVIDMKLSGGVSIGANADELMAAAKENGYYVKDEIEDGYLTVAKSEDDKYDNYVEFWINTKEDADAIAGFRCVNKTVAE